VVKKGKLGATEAAPDSGNILQAKKIVEAIGISPENFTASLCRAS
jgi:hypothetical protein